MSGVDDMDLHRMDDDGAPQPRERDVIPFRIGIAPEPAPKPELKLVGTEPERKVVDNGGIVLKDVRQPKERKRVRIPADENGPARMVHQPADDKHPVPGPSMLVDANGRPIAAFNPSMAPELVAINGDTLNSLTWPAYLAWRKTKCRPFDYEQGPMQATDKPDRPTFASVNGITRERALEEIDQATLEFIGEVAELCELFQANGGATFLGEARTKLIDECGDILFCGAWTLDAWGLNPLAESDDLEILRVTDEDMLAELAGFIAGNEPGIVLGNQRFMAIMGGTVFRILLDAQVNAGLLANSFKKLRYQRREQDVKKQVERVFRTLFCVNQILIIANSSVEEALKTNMRKLDARFPDGYKPGQGGGNRTGEGA